MTPMIKIKTVYEPAKKEDNFRILVDRLWPRGLSKEKAKIDLWLKEVGPSDELRQWFSHDPKKWESFKTRYRTELEKKSDCLESIKQSEKEKGMVTLLFGSKEEKYNNAVALKEFLDRT
jgi:uncharacterized protein YeaO (DUF488 family)